MAWNRTPPLALKPLRDELLSIERLEERARALAARFTLDPNPRRAARNVLPRFDDNARVLREAYVTMADDVHRGEFVTPAAEWLLDNFHLVASEILDVRRNLPPGYYRELPKLALRELAGDARVYAMAVELIRHSDSRLDRQQLVRFMNSYQAVAPLTIGELWAWPSMLKLALIENLRRLAEETLEARAAVRAADAYVARIDAAGHGRPPPLPERLHTGYVVQLLQRLREYGPRLSAVRSAVDAHLLAQEMTSEDAIRSEHQRQAAAQVSVANVITSLRLCGALDWSQYFEAVSLIERVLQRDPAGAYGSMDFLSRDRYRQAVEELSEPTGEAQLRVALRAVESARQAAESGLGGRPRRPRRPPPHRQGPPRPRDRRRLPPPPRPTGAALRLRPRDGRLSRIDRASDRAPRRARPRGPPGNRVAAVADGGRAPPAAARPARWRSRSCSAWPPAGRRRGACPASSSPRTSPRTRGRWWSCPRSSRACPASRG